MDSRKRWFIINIKMDRKFSFSSTLIVLFFVAVASTLITLLYNLAYPTDQLSVHISTVNLNSVDTSLAPRMITADEMKEHNSDDSYWVVIEGWVVDATAFVAHHPGGYTKIHSANSAAAGATGKPYGFSFHEGYNSHNPPTMRRWDEGLKEYLEGTANSQGGMNDDNGCLPPYDLTFPDIGTIVIIGKFKYEEEGFNT